MGKLGELLRETRQGKGVSLAEVEKVTKIRQKYLEALEEGDYPRLPGEVFVKGFLRNYALYLGLDPGEVMALYKEEGGEATVAPIQPVARPLSSPSWLTPDLFIAAAIFLLIGLFGVWAYQQYFVPLAVATPTPSVSAVIAAIPQTATPTPTAAPAPTPAPTPTPFQGVKVRFDVVQRTWLRVMVDGEVVFEGILDKGATRTWVGQERIAVRCGNAGGVVITVNERREGPLGGSGQVVDREWVAGDDKLSRLTSAQSSNEARRRDNLSEGGAIAPTPPGIP